MKVVTEELSATLTAMSVKYGEELDLELGLLVAVWLKSWLLEVKHNRDSVLVVVSDQSIVGVCSVSDHVRSQSLLRHLRFLDNWA